MECLGLACPPQPIANARQDGGHMMLNDPEHRSEVADHIVISRSVLKAFDASLARRKAL